MPYINAKDGRRELLRKGDTAQSAGELNYQIFSYVKYAGDDILLGQMKEQIEKYVKNFLGPLGKRNYQRYNDFVGCLTCCGKEIKRRLGYNFQILDIILKDYELEINMYEDKKIEENGEV